MNVEGYEEDKVACAGQEGATCRKISLVAHIHPSENQGYVPIQFR